ncbi:hypothetical protein C4D60_Mb03t00660 [Musa balbisiana]|uniref:Stress-related protein n=1 Tax=Musa balbisiana TaxID=52838 RepID=A0A4S8J6K3_MUSBA|nr:hypothetical protein C4D60_Mb03t00660 [Musa balbisiana]
MKPRTDGFVSAYNFPCVPSAALDRRGRLCLRREVANGPTKRNAARHGATRRVIERPPHRPIRAPHNSSPYINEPRSDRLDPKLLRSEIVSFFSRRSSSDSIVPRMTDPVTESPQIAQEEAMEQERLRYLEFVHAAAIHAVLCAARLYVYAKESAGPLRPGVQTVEGTVKTVVGPVYDKFHGVPFELLKFVDRKVEVTVQELDRRVPSVVKEASSAARSAAGEVQRAGLVGSAAGLVRSVYAKYEPAAKELYAKYEPAAELAAASAWRSLNRLPLVPQVAQVVVPTAAHLSEKYNQAVSSSAEKGYAVSAYLPLVPTERMARVFGDNVATAAH